MMFDDPWSEIQIPDGINSLNARRVNAVGRWDFFWARSIDQKCLLLLSYDVQSASKRQPPRLRGLEIKIVANDNIDRRSLIFRLLDNDHRDIFFRFCKDIIAFANEAKTEKEVIEKIMVRTWRWHYLLRTGQSRLLSPEEQKGLIGELLVLERHLLPNLTVLDAVEAWVGPLEHPKDFEYGRLCIEAKTRRGTASPQIVVNSEHQLDSEGIDILFLHVVELDKISSNTNQGVSLTDVASRIYSSLGERGSEAVELMEARLIASGFLWEDDYSSHRWMEGKSELYRVTDKFPRIVSWGLKSGIANVRYSVSLTDCQPYRCDSQELIQSLRAMRDG